jgi:hypothetical protein
MGKREKERERDRKRERDGIMLLQNLLTDVTTAANFAMSFPHHFFTFFSHFFTKLIKSSKHHQVFIVLYVLSKLLTKEKLLR